jgi:hypothetical protein
MTRAMDNLNVFVMEEARESAVKELVGAMNGWGRGRGEYEHLFLKRFTHFFNKEIYYTSIVE